MNAKLKFAAVAAIVFWSSAFAGIRYGLHGFSPGGLALMRYLVASFCMALIYPVYKPKNPFVFKHYLAILGVGVVGIGLYNTMLNYGEITVTAGVASFLLGLVPVLTIVISVVFLKEQLPQRSWIGVGLSFIGLILLVLGEPNSQGLDLGIFYILLAVFAGCAYHIFSKRYLQYYHPIHVTAWIMWGGTLSLMVFLPNLIADLKQASTAETLVVIYLGIFPAAIAYFAWNYVLQHSKASTAAIIMLTLPFFSTLMGLIFLYEIPTFYSFVGGVIAMLGALLASGIKWRKWR